MKGIVFSEFNDMVEQRFSLETLDHIISQADLPSGGAYTSVGTYDHREILLLVECLSRETGISPDELIKAFGQHLASRFSVLYPSFFDRVDDVFGFLASIENHVHVEVRKLYPDAELPSFRTEPIGDHAMRMIYESRHPFADLAEGLIIGCSMHFGESISIERIEDNDDTLRRTEFMLSKQA